MYGTAHGLASHDYIVASTFDDGNGYFTPVLTFFILQAVGLTIEALFLDLPGRDIVLYEFGLPWERIYGRLWTFGWLLVSGQRVVDCWLKMPQGALPLESSIVVLILGHLGMHIRQC